MTTQLAFWTIPFFQTSMIQVTDWTLISSLFGSFLVVGITTLWLKRRQTKISLERCGLPTVHWRPRFIHFSLSEESQKLASSTITNILPRMERLGGPYGMYGTVYGISTKVVHVAHPVPAKAIFTAGTTAGTSSNPSNRRSSISNSCGASKAPAYDHFKNFCGEGVFTADGDDWKAKRSSVMHCLIRGPKNSSGDLAERLELEANRAADAFSIQLDRLKDTQGSQKVTTNMVPLLQRATVGLIYRYITHHEPAWGFLQKTQQELLDDPSVETESLSSDDESEGFRQKVDEPEPSHPTIVALFETYLQSIMRIRMIILAQSRSIWFLLPRWCYQTFSSLYKDEEETVQPIRQFSKQACDNAKPGSPLFQLRELESHNKGPLMNDVPKDLLDEAITLLFAGQDTSAATLSWTLHLLSLYPSIQSKLADEVCKVLREEGEFKKKSPRISKKVISKLPYLDAVVKESMRLYPVAPFVVRRITHDLPIKEECDDKPVVVLPAGSLACIWIYGLHRNPKLWARPNDFIPERWIDPKLKDAGQTTGAYMPFAAGPRNCVGQPLAHIILRTLLTRLVHRYEFRDERMEHGANAIELRKDMQAGFTVLPSGGVTLAVQSRVNE